MFLYKGQHQDVISNIGQTIWVVTNFFVLDQDSAGENVDMINREKQTLPLTIN